MAITDLLTGSFRSNTSIVRAVVQGIDAQGYVLVSPDATGHLIPCELLHTGAAAESPDVGSVVLVLQPEDPAESLPVVLGRVGPALSPAVLPSSPPPSPLDVVRIEAEQTLVLRAGDASITLRQDGKVLIKGKDIVSHAQATNRVKGGSVAIN